MVIVVLLRCDNDGWGRHRRRRQLRRGGMHRGVVLSVSRPRQLATGLHWCLPVAVGGVRFPTPPTGLYLCLSIAVGGVRFPTPPTGFVSFDISLLGPRSASAPLMATFGETDDEGGDDTIDDDDAASFSGASGMIGSGSAFGASASRLAKDGVSALGSSLECCTHTSLFHDRIPPR